MEGRVTGSEQCYVLIGHNIYWELVKIHTFDLTGMLTDDKTQLLSPIYLHFKGKSI